MPTLRNNFDGGPDGALVTIANSGQYGNNPFDITANDPGVVLEYAHVGLNNLNRPTAEYVLKMETTPSSPRPFLYWGASMSGQIVTWTRFYIYFSQAISTNATDFNMYAPVKNGEGPGIWLQTSTTPFALQIRSQDGVKTTMTTPIVAQEWFRVEFYCSMAGGQNGGDSELRYYSGANTDTTTPTETISQANEDYGGAIADGYFLGQTWAHQFNMAPVYFSNWELNNVGWPGPAPFRAGKGVPGILSTPMAVHSDCS